MMSKRIEFRLKKFSKRISLLISVLLVSSLGITASGTEAAFEDSATAQVTGTAAKISAAMNGLSVMYPYLSTSEQIKVDGTTFPGSTYTITNNGTLDGNFSISIDPSASELDQKTLLNHTRSKIIVNGNVVYDGPLNAVNTTPVRINVGDTANFNFGLSIMYSPDLDSVANNGDYQSIPIVIKFIPTDIPNSTFSVFSSGHISYRMLKWKITAEDLYVYAGTFDDRCVDVQWPGFGLDPLKFGSDFTLTGNSAFKYSRSPDMSNAITMDLTYKYVQLQSLSFNTKYYYQVLAKDSVRPTWSEVYSFTTGNRDGGDWWSCA